MRIVLDLQGAQTLGSRNRGIGRYALGLAGGMARAANPQIDLKVTLNGAFPDTIEPIVAALKADLPRSAFSVYTPPSGATWPPPPEGDPAQAALAAAARLHIATLEPDAVLLSSVMEGAGASDLAGFDPALPGVLSAAVLYDLTPLHDPACFLTNPTVHAYYHRQLDILRRTGLLLAISEATRADGITQLAREPADVVAIGAATDPIFWTTPRGRRGTNLPKGPYLLLLGGADPNKNLAHGLEAVGRLSETLRAGRTLLHAGVLAPEVRIALEQQMAGRMEMRFLGHVPDATLINALDHAEAVLFPSRREGFGLPALEAMIRGTPVLASNATSLPEVVSETALLTDPHDPASLTEALARLLEEPEMRREIGARLRARSKQFSWDAVGAKALSAIGTTTRVRRSSHLRPPATYGMLEALTECARPTAVKGLRSEAVVDALLLSGRIGGELGPPRLLVDVTQTSQSDAGTGIQRVTNATIIHLKSVLDEVGGRRSVVPVVLRESRLHTATKFGAATETNVPLRAGETLLMLDSSWEQYPDFKPEFETLRRHGGRVITVVYDLVPMLHPDLVLRAMPQVFEMWLRLALVESDGLVCISKAVADEVAAYIRDHDLPHRDGLRIGWWHLGSDLPTNGDDAAPRAALADFLAQDAAPTFLMVGTVEPRKRHNTALAALERLWEDGSEARLLVMGREGWNVSGLAARLRGHPETGRRLLWVEGPTDAELASSYASASALLFPSVYEGYGLPVVEAARAGLGAICSDIPVLREVGGDGALYVPVDDPTAWAAVIADVAAGRQAPDPAHTPALSWDDSARQLLEVLYDDRWHTVLRRRVSPVPKAVEAPATAGGGSDPLRNYVASFDPAVLIAQHHLPDQAPEPGVVTNFVGVRIPPAVMPSVLEPMQGTVEGPPDPGNWHADIAEWGAAIHAVTAAGDTFRMVELGCGWGCWMTITGVVAKRLGKTVGLVGIEGDPGHLDNAATVLRMNGFAPDEFRLINGIAAPRPGTALFPIPRDEGEAWGGEAIFHPEPELRERLLAAGHHRELRCHTLRDLSDAELLDLLHVDIQGSEVDFAKANMADLNAVVRRVLIGSHSHEIERRLMALFLAEGWVLEVERPSIHHIVAGRPMLQIDGVQMWRNPALVSA